MDLFDLANYAKSIQGAKSSSQKPPISTSANTQHNNQAIGLLSLPPQVTLERQNSKEKANQFMNEKANQFMNEKANQLMNDPQANRNQIATTPIHNKTGESLKSTTQSSLLPTPQFTIPRAPASGSALLQSLSPYLQNSSPLAYPNGSTDHVPALQGDNLDHTRFFAPNSSEKNVSQSMPSFGFQIGAQNGLLPLPHPVSVATEPLAPRYECKSCERGYNTHFYFQKHLESHVKCHFPKCDFEARPEVVEHHGREVHNPFVIMLQSRLETPEQVQKWREARIKNFPTQARILKKQRIEKLKAERGELLVSELLRPPKVKDAVPVSQRQTEFHVTNLPANLDEQDFAKFWKGALPKPDAFVQFRTCGHFGFLTVRGAFKLAQLQGLQYKGHRLKVTLSFQNNPQGVSKSQKVSFNDQTNGNHNNNNSQNHNNQNNNNNQTNTKQNNNNTNEAQRSTRKEDKKDQGPIEIPLTGPAEGTLPLNQGGRVDRSKYASSNFERMPVAPRNVRDLPPGWKQMKTASGLTYFYHPESRSVSWVLPSKAPMEGPDFPQLVHQEVFLKRLLANQIVRERSAILQIFRYLVRENFFQATSLPTQPFQQGEWFCNGCGVCQDFDGLQLQKSLSSEKTFSAEDEEEEKHTCKCGCAVSEHVQVAKLVQSQSLEEDAGPPQICRQCRVCSGYCPESDLLTRCVCGCPVAAHVEEYSSSEDDDENDDDEEDF